MGLMFSRTELCNILVGCAILYMVWMGHFFYNAGPDFPWGGPDFARSYSVAEMVRDGNAAQVYNTPLFLKKIATHISDKGALSTGWLYPPFYSLMLEPLACLPYKTAFFMSVLAQTALFLAAGHRFLWGNSYRVFALFSSCFVMAIFWGQNSVFIAALYIAAFRFLTNKQRLSGILFGIAMVKPQMGILVPFLLIAGRYYTAFFTAVFVGLGLSLFSIALYGEGPWFGYMYGLFGSLSDEHTGSILHAAQTLGMPSIYTMVQSMGASDMVSKVVQIISAFICVIGLLYTRTAWKHNPKLALLYLSGFTLFATPYLGIYDYTLAITMIVAAFFALPDNETFRYPAVIVAFVLPFVAFIHVFMFVAKSLILAPFIMAMIYLYIRNNKQLRFTQG